MIDKTFALTMISNYPILNKCVFFISFVYMNECIGSPYSMVLGHQLNKIILESQLSLYNHIFKKERVITFVHF